MDVSNDSYTESLIFFYVIKTYDIAVKYKPIYFSNETLRKLFEVIQPHVIQYKEPPTLEQTEMILQREGMLTDNIKDVIQSLWQINSQLSQYSDSWLRDCAKSYAEWNNFLFSINHMHTYLLTIQNGITVENCHEYVQKIQSMFTADANFSFNESVGHDFFDPEEHKMVKQDMFTSGWPFVDACLGGGFARKTLSVIAGGPKIGKSQFLCNIVANLIRTGKNVLYVTLEMGVEIVNKRIGSNLFNIRYQDYDKIAEDPNVLKEYMKNFYNQSFTQPGSLIVEQFPAASLTPLELESYILSVENARSTEEKPFKFDAIAVDYLNIMKSSRPGVTDEASFSKIRGIAEDLRRVGFVTNTAIITLTQLNRSAINASEITQAMISESTGTTATADAVIGIIRTNAMSAAGYYYLTGLALRNSQHQNDRKRYIFQSDYMRIIEDDSEGILTEGIPYPDELVVGASDYQPQNNYSHRKSSSQSQSSQQQPHSNTPVQQPAPPKAPDLGATELKISGYDLFQ